MGVLAACKSVYQVSAMPTEIRREWQIPWDWSHKQLDTMWVIGIKPGSSRRVASVLNH